MLHLYTVVRFFARRLKVNMAQAQTKTNDQKTKFSEQDIIEMAGYKEGGRSSIKIFKEKIQQKIKANKQQKNVQSINQDDDIDDDDVGSNYQKRVKKPKEFYEKFKSPHLSKSQRVTSQQISLKQLSQIRLEPQYLPMHFMQRVKKVFHKYSQAQLREIAEHFAYYTKLRYNEQKFDYELYPDLGFQKLEYKPPVGGLKPEEPIYLIGRSRIYEEKDEQIKTRKVDEDPIKNDLSYTQNIVVSYLLLRVPKTYAVATRIMTEIKYKFQNFKPRTFIDFGSGLGSGSLAYYDAFQNDPNQFHQVFSVEPSPKMAKMSQYLNPEKIQFFKSLGELSSKVKDVDIVYAGYVLNEIDPELVEVYLESLWMKVKNQGFLVLVEHGNPFGARIIHQSRKWILKKANASIAAPCPHHMRCPLAKSSEWCHFDQPVGMYPREVFGHLPNDNQVKLQKFSYLVIQKTSKDENEEQVKSNETSEWDRIIFPLIKRGGHFGMNLCTKKGTFERRFIARSNGQEYKEGRKLRWGDLWRFGKRIPNKFRKQRETGKRLW